MKPSNHYATILGLTALICLTITACIREKQNVYPDKGTTDSTATDSSNKCPLSGVYSISITGGKHVGDSFMLSSNTPPCAKRTWYIYHPDRKNEIIKTLGPKLRLSMAGNYSITLVINDDSLNKNGFNSTTTITVTHPYDAAIVQLMNKSYNWHVQEDSFVYKYTQIEEKRTIKQYDDTFDITVLDAVTIKVKDKVLNAWSYENTVGVVDKYTFLAPDNTSLQWHTLEYYFQKDSIVCYFHPYQGGSPAAGKKAAQPYGITTTYTSKK